MINVKFQLLSQCQAEMTPVKSCVMKADFREMYKRMSAVYCGLGINSVEVGEKP